MRKVQAVINGNFCPDGALGGWVEFVTWIRVMDKIILYGNLNRKILRG